MKKEVAHSHLLHCCKFLFDSLFVGDAEGGVPYAPFVKQEFDGFYTDAS